MIVAYSEKLNKRLIVESVINKEDITCDWYYLLGFGFGFDTLFIAVRANTLQDALDYYADSSKKHLTLIDRNKLNLDYLQSGRKKVLTCLQKLRKYHVNEIKEGLLEPSYTKDEVKRKLYILIRELKELAETINTINDDDWDENGPYDIDMVTFLGNYGDPHDITELRLVEAIPLDQIRFFEKKQMELELPDKPFKMKEEKPVKENNVIEYPMITTEKEV